MRKLFYYVVFGAALVTRVCSLQSEGSEPQISRLTAIETNPLESFATDTIVRGQTVAEFTSLDNLGGCTDGATCNSCQQSCGGECLGGWRDNTEIWFGGDAYKSIGDSGMSGFAPLPFAIGDSFGTVAGFNTAFALGDSRVRAQIGGSFGAYDFKGRLTTAPALDNSLEQQTYTTVGFYKRSDIAECDPISWGLVYDNFFGHQWGWAGNQTFLSQVRGIFGYALNECNEVGVWGTFHTQNDIADLGFPIGAIRTPIRAMNQANTFLRHNWEFGGSTMGYVGVFDKADVASWQLGLLNQAPLSNNLSLYGNFTYVVPSSATGLVGVAEEQWNVSVGLVYSFGGKAVAKNVSGQQGLALLPVANNGNFLITN